MHPSLVRSHVVQSVADLRARLEDDGDHGVTEVRLDAESLKLDITFDHDEHETELVAARSTLLLPDGSPLTRPQRIPIIGRSRIRRLVLHLELDSYDLLPPIATLRRESGDPLPAEEWPTSFAGGGIVNDHPIYHRPFFCRRGLREYHSHEQHEDDSWAAWRDALPLHVVVVELLTDLRVRWHGAA
ncbi:MAG: hypothetical protein ABIX10_08080 [Acidimicrobiales bacterium]